MDNLFEFMRFTLLAHQISENLQSEVETALNDLIRTGFLKKTENGLESALLGQATFHSSLSPDEAQIVKHELQNCMKNLVLNDELHLVYVITPIFNLPPVCWETYSKLMRNLTPSQLTIASTNSIYFFLIFVDNSKLISFFFFVLVIDMCGVQEG